MTSLVDALYQVKYNPFKYGEFLASFYSELTNVEHDLLLSQLVIPLSSHHLFFRKLSNAKMSNTKNTSTIWTIFNDRKLLYDLQERLDEFKTMTDRSLQYCLVNDWLEIDAQALSVSPCRTSEVKFKKQKSAANLGRLFSNLSVIEIYAFFGVRPR